MANTDRSKLSKTKDVPRNIHQLYDCLHAGKAEDDEGGYRAKWEAL